MQCVTGRDAWWAFLRAHTLGGSAVPPGHTSVVAPHPTCHAPGNASSIRLFTFIWKFLISTLGRVCTGPGDSKMKEIQLLFSLLLSSLFFFYFSSLLPSLPLSPLLSSPLLKVWETLIFKGQTLIFKGKRNPRGSEKSEQSDRLEADKNHVMAHSRKLLS